MNKEYTSFYLGTRHDKSRVTLVRPSFDCGWYWSFGYLRTTDEHYHLDSILQFEKIKEHFAELNPGLQSEDNLWKFLEIAKTIYTLKVTAEVLGRGGSHISKNPCAHLIINKPEVDKINNIVLPALFTQIELLLK